MSIFSKEDESVDFKNVETVIGPSVKVEGNLVCAGDVVVEGEVVGTLRTTKNLRIGDQAKVRADIEADNIIVAGEIRGNVKTGSKLELLATGKIFGNVSANLIAVETGAILHGKCQMAGKNGAPVPSEAAPEPLGAPANEHEKKTNRKEKERFS